MGKVLFTSHTANFVKFNKAYMKWFQEQGWEVHYASLDEEEIPCCDRHFRVQFNRSPYSFENIIAYMQLKKIIVEEEYDIIHCHTPMGGVITRLASRKARKAGTKVFYTAHGFHFYKGAPLLNWMLYYPVEYLLSFITDVLITINYEDYVCARKKFHSQELIKLDGVGIDLSRFCIQSIVEKRLLREKYGYIDKDFILLCVGELNKNKNQEFLIDCCKELRKVIPDIKLVVAGTGKYRERLTQKITNLQLNEIVNLTGYVQNIQELYGLSDLLVSVSCREGLPVNILEGMASGLPVVCTNIRGQTDIIKQGRNGFLFSCNNKEELYNAILKIYNSVYLQNEISKNNRQDAQKYALGKSIDKMSEIYKRYM